MLFFLPCLTLAAAYLASDDECSSGSCALDALQLRARREDYELLCSRASQVCADGGVAKGLTIEQLHLVLAVANSTLQAFADASGLDLDLRREGFVTCQELCEASAHLVHSRGIKLPPRPDVGCFRNAKGEDVCDVDLSPEALKKRVQLDDDEEAEMMAQPMYKRLKSHRVVSHHRMVEPPRWQNPLQFAFEREVNTFSSELALRILYMFHIYPRAFNTFQGSKDAEPTDWHDKLANFNLVARVFIINAIRKLRLHQTTAQLSTWLGHSSLGANMEDTRREVLRLLNSAVHVMDSAQFIYNSSECDDDTFAFVFPSNADGVPDQEDFFRKNQKEQYVVYVCPLTVNAEQFGLLSDAVQTMVHESSHHQYAYTDDVFSCPRAHYLWLQTDGLMSLGGRSCTGASKPRYSIGGLSCNVPGEELLGLSNWTRQTYERGVFGAPGCPANMMDLEDAEDCRLAAQQLGLPFIKELEVLEPEDGAVWEQEAYPTGCFVDSLEDDGQSVYFNPAVGSGTVSAQPVCRSMPAEVPDLGGICPERYSKRRGRGCELALPFEILEGNSSSCPEEMQRVVKVRHCLEAVDIYGLKYAGHIASEDQPYGCIKDLEQNVLAFNIMDGPRHPEVALVCRQAFSFSVLDPRLLYTMSLLRFSQDGEAALFSLQDSAFTTMDCEMAYGTYNCKELAKTDPTKALLNADSFGYYVLDAGAPKEELD